MLSYRLVQYSGSEVSESRVLCSIPTQRTTSLDKENTIFFFYVSVFTPHLSSEIFVMTIIFHESPAPLSVVRFSSPRANLSRQNEYRFLVCTPNTHFCVKSGGAASVCKRRLDPRNDFERGRSIDRFSPRKLWHFYSFPPRIPFFSVFIVLSFELYHLDLYTFGITRIYLRCARLRSLPFLSFK